MKTEIDDFDKSSDNLFLKTDIGKFFVKSLIVVAMIFGGIYFLIPDARVFKGLETDQNKYIALTLIQNPRILWKMSETDESKGNLPTLSVIWKWQSVYLKCTALALRSYKSTKIDYKH